MTHPDRQQLPPSYPDDVVAVMRATITALREHAEALAAKFAGPRCELCGNLCVDLAKDENGYCPDCSGLAGEIASAGHQETT